ncbi:MAG: PLP-dependent aspartate aminotransferase family protein [Gemmatimonadota bacterium]|nr:PLP-dependent aspartate aminotransferase family protein [Gemmatimonadota bacterium]MDH4350668.1 PLP-dependent aspartate aminotransferase family protein [Gemmatimonadota bacterium]MDH5197302.1 PLP-dependent aspartate aminotransferase family protein [Gemmatimonadota bacterium]
MNRRRLGLSTRAVHGTPQTPSPQAPVSTPIVQSSTFTNAVGSSEEVLYTRYGNNPNQVSLAQRLAALEDGEAAIFLGSGMGATAMAHLAILAPGDHLLSSDWIYGGTRRLFASQFGRLGIEVAFADPTNPRSWKRGLRPNTRAVFIETPTNPLMRLIDLEPLASLCHTEGIALIVDSTFASPVNLRPLEHGADVVIHSATKYLNGHSDVIAGAVVGTDEVIEEVRQLMQVWGPALDPHAAWLVERGLKTLDIRMARHNANGLAFAEWATGVSAFAQVHYPGLPSHPDHAIAATQYDGFGGMVGLEVRGGAEAAERMLRRLRIAKHAPSLGGVETLVSEPRLTSHAALTPAQRAAQGIPDGFVRVSLGIEDVEDVIADFTRALRQPARA